MRIIMFAGKGGVGKTSIASATGIKSAANGHKTLIMSLDIAHSLSDVFDLDRDLMDRNSGMPVHVGDNLWIQEIDIQEEIHTNWGEVHQYIAMLFNTTGLNEVLAEELAILPGMEEVSSLLHINRYVKSKQFDVIILDCAPTGESLRFISIPTALEWYIGKIFNIQRRAVGIIRPVAKPFLDVPLPEDSYFKALENLFQQVRGVDKVITDHKITTVRLVTNPEKIVLKETQRAFLFFSLYKMCIDAIIINRILPGDVEENYFRGWKELQRKNIHLANEFFSPVPLFTVNLFQDEPLGIKKLAKLGEHIYGKRNPTQRFFTETPYDFNKKDGGVILKVKLPFISKDEISLSKIAEDLIIRVGSFKKTVPLPQNVAAYNNISAKMENNYLNIIFEGRKYGKEKRKHSGKH